MAKADVRADDRPGPDPRPTPTQDELDAIATGGYPDLAYDWSGLDPNQPPPPPPAPEGPSPVLTSLVPSSAISGDPDFTLSCRGSNFTDQTIIRFENYDEPTTLVSDTEVTTGVKPSLWAPSTVQVRVHNGIQYSDPMDFTFTAPVEGARRQREESRHGRGKEAA